VFTTDGAGKFFAHAGTSEGCSTTATLTFEKEGYAPLAVTFKGSEEGAEVCLSPAVDMP
jgi:hypothetical protein